MGNDSFFPRTPLKRYGSGADFPFGSRLPRVVTPGLPAQPSNNDLPSWLKDNTPPTDEIIERLGIIDRLRKGAPPTVLDPSNAPPPEEYGKPKIASPGDIFITPGITYPSVFSVADSSSDGVLLDIEGRKTQIGTNVLNDYIDVSYRITFSMVPEEIVKNYQKGYPFPTFDEEREKVIDRATGITLASTGHVHDDPFSSTDTITGIEEQSVYVISDLTMNNILEPTKQNPVISHMIEMKMTLKEPVGFNFYEDVRKAAKELGYEDVHVALAVYRVDIQFSGYLPSGEWVETIDLGGGVTTISYFVSITNANVTVGPDGSTYTIDLAPYVQRAYRPEEIVFDAQTIPSGRTFGEFLTNLSHALEESKKKRTDGKITREYEFIAPPFLLESPFDANGLIAKTEQFISDGGDPNHAITLGKRIVLTDLLKNAIENTVVAQELFVAEKGNDSFTTPRVMFTIRFNVIYDTKSPELGDYAHMKFQFFIEPFISFRTAPVRPDNIDNILAPGNQLERINRILEYGMVRRVYNYLFTPDNTEVINLDINMKWFHFFSSLFSPSSKTPARSASEAGDRPSSIVEDLERKGIDVRDLARFLRENGEGDVVDRILGNVATGDGKERMGSSFNDTFFTDYTNDTSSPPDSMREKYIYYMNDYLERTLVNIDNLGIRGDPVWLLSSYSEPRPSIGVDMHVRGTDTVETVRSNVGNVIFLNMIPPRQEDYMNPDVNLSSSHPLVIGGFYQVTKVTSSFRDGSFTQSIKAVKLTHLNYIDRNVIPG